MVNDNKIDFTVRVNREGVGELAQDLGKVEEHARGLEAASTDAGNGLDTMEQAAKGAAGGAHGLGKALDDTSTQTTGLEGTLSQLGKTLAGLFAAREIVGFAKNAIEVADAYGQMAERIRMATGSTEEYELVQKRLLESANITYRSLSEQQELYIQTGDALRSMGYETSQVLDITDSFSYLLATNAASAEKGRNAIDAYTKSIQSGKVEADSWQSIMAATPTIVDAIATSTGKTAAEIRNLGVTGQLTVTDLNEGLRQTMEVNKSATAGMVTTVNDAMTRLHNTWSAYIGEANRATQSTQKIVALIDTLSNNLDTVVSAAIVAGDVMVAVWGVRALGALKAYTAQLSIAAAETTALMAATTAAGAKMAAGLATAGKLAAAAWIGWEIGTFLRSEFQVVEQAGIALAAGLTKTAARAQSAWEMIKAAFTDDTVEAAQERLRKKLEEIDDEYAALFAGATKAALAQQQSAQATASAGAAAAQAGDDWHKLNNGYRLVLDSVREQITLAEKEVAAAKARGDAAIAEAKLLGDEAALRKAVGQAAADEAKALADLAAKRQTELSTLQAQLKSLQDEVAGRGQVSDARTKEMAELEQLIAKKQIEADTTRAQAAAAQQNARAKGEEVQAAQAALSAAQAATVARVSEAQASVSLLETQKSLAAQGEQLARLMGDESAARRFRIEQLKIDIQLTQAKAEVQRAEAEGSIAVANATMAELRAKGELTAVKEAELNASIRLAQARLKEADAIGQSTRVTEQAISNLRLFGNEAGKAGERGHGAGQRVAAGWKSAAGAIGSATQALDDYQRRMQDKYGRPGEGVPNKFEDGRKSTRGEDLGKGVEEIGTGGHQFRNKDGMTSDAQGNVQQQWVWTRASIIEYLQQAGLDELLAEDLAKQFVKPDGTVPYMASAAQKQWGGKYSTLAGALGKMVDYYKYGGGKHEAEERTRFLKGAQQGGTPSASTAATHNASSGKASRSPSSGAGASSGASYVSNITIQGQPRTLKYADRQSQLDGDALIRELAEGKGVAQ